MLSYEIEINIIHVCGWSVRKSKKTDIVNRIIKQLNLICIKYYNKILQYQTCFILPTKNIGSQNNHLSNDVPKKNIINKYTLNETKIIKGN